MLKKKKIDAITNELGFNLEKNKFYSEIINESLKIGFKKNYMIIVFKKKKNIIIFIYKKQ